MKKNILLICLILLASGCELKKENSETTTTTTTTTKNIEIVDTYKDDNPIIVGIYNWNNTNTKRYLVKEFTNTWEYHKDITTFNVYFTNDEEIDGTRIPDCFNKYAENYEDPFKYKIGFHIEFSVGDVTYNKTILRPNDPNEFFDYLEIYLYDGYHRKPGEWYSHTTEEQMTTETLLTSIKLTAGKKNQEITSNIVLTAFSYDDEEDFDKNGNYRGNSKYTINIIRN